LFNFSSHLTIIALSYLIAASISAVLAVAEIVTVFEKDSRRALSTGGAALLILINVAFSILILLLVNTVGGTPDGKNQLWVALGVGLGFPTLLRTRFTFIKPLPGSSEEGVAVSLDELYGRLQRFCRQQIDQSLATGRVQMVDDAMRQLDIGTLEKHLRLLLEGGLVLADPAATGYVDKILNQANYTEDRQKMLLAFGLLNYGGYRTIRQMLKDGPAPLIKKSRRRIFRKKKKSTASANSHEII
jgi:DNA-binding transcriptional ArsR family regulator